MKCRICKRKLGTKHAAAGIGPICAKKQKADGGRSANVKIVCFAKPRTTKESRRTWFYQRQGEPSYLVRIYPDATGDGRTATCDCQAGRASESCEHVEAVAAADKRKFYGEGNQTNEQI